MCSNEDRGTDPSQVAAKANSCSENFIERIHSVTELNALPRVWGTSTSLNNYVGTNAGEAAQTLLQKSALCVM